MSSFDHSYQLACIGYVVHAFLKQSNQKACHIAKLSGLTTSAVSKIVHGHQELDFTQMITLCKALRAQVAMFSACYEELLNHSETRELFEREPEIVFKFRSHSARKILQDKSLL